MRMDTDRRFGLLGFASAAVVLAALAAPGCGGGSPYKILPVTGKLTYSDGSLIPADQIRVTFVPQAEAIDQKTHARHGIAYLDEETGEFTSMTTSKYGDGATVGKNKVQIIGTDENGQPSKAIPRKYADPATSGLEVEVGPGKTHFELTIDKP